MKELDGNEYPDCWCSTCEAEPGGASITNCIHCGAELRQVGNCWYHHDQFDFKGNLISPEYPQDFLTPVKP